jgi:hypothetical protein
VRRRQGHIGGGPGRGTEADAGGGGGEPGHGGGGTQTRPMMEEGLRCGGGRGARRWPSAMRGGRQRHVEELVETEGGGVV